MLVADCFAGGKVYSRETGHLLATRLFALLPNGLPQEGPMVLQ